MESQGIELKIAAEIQNAVAAKVTPLSEELRHLKETLFTSLGTLEQKVKVAVEKEVAGIVESHVRPLIEAAQAAQAAKLAARGPSLFDALLTIERSRTQVEILNNLLAAVHALAPRVLLAVVRGETLVGWSSKGLPLSDAEVKRLVIPLTAGSSLKHVVDSVDFFWGDAASHPANRKLFDMLGGGSPREILLTPLVLKSKVMAVLYCDDGGKDGALTMVEDVKILAWTTSNMLDSLSYRAKVTRPLPPQIAAAEAQAAPAHPAPAPAAPPAAAAPPPATADPRAVTVHDARAGTNPELIRMAPEPSAPPVPQADELSPEEKKRHDDARRLARVLVADLILYHRSDVELGKRNKDLYHRLREDIERSRQAYRERVGPDLAAKTNYLYEELVKTLADGRPEILAGY